MITCKVTGWYKIQSNKYYYYKPQGNSMKLIELANLLQAIRLQQSQDNKPPVKFAYCLAKNAELLQKEVDLYNKTINDDEDSEVLTKFESRRLEIIQDHCIKDELGNPITENNSFTFEDTAGSIKAIQAVIDEEFPGLEAILAKRQRRVADLEQTEVEITLHRVPLECWPDVDQSVMNTMWRLVKD